MREARKAERAAWVTRVVKENNPLDTARDVLNVFRCHPLTAVKRENELIPGFVASPRIIQKAGSDRVLLSNARGPATWAVQFAQDRL